MRRGFLGSSAAAGVVLFASAIACRAAAEVSPSSSSGGAACDESKCRNPGRYGGYTCLAAASEPNSNSTEDQLYAHQCAHGYQSRPIEDVPPVTDHDGVTYVYYTCCHPEYNGTVSQDCRYDIFEACTRISPGDDGWERFDCWVAGTFQDPMTCSSGPISSTANYGSNVHDNGDMVPYFPRKTGATIEWIMQYVCCRTFDGVTKSVEPSSAIYHGFGAAIDFVVFLVCVIFIAGIMLSRKARSQEFNLYLVFLAIPDAIYNGGQFIANAGLLGVRGLRLYHLRSWIWWFNVSSNMSINAIIAYEIHCMLVKAKRCRRRKTGPRSKYRVCTQAGAAYAFAVVPAMGDLLIRQGLVWWQQRYFWIALVLVTGPPLLYFLYVYVDIRRRRLLPRSGRTRTLAIYFNRAIFVFPFMWGASTIMYQVGWAINAVWMLYTGNFIIKLQPLVSVAVATNKPDVRGAVMDLIMCHFNDSEADKAVPASGDREHNPSSDDNTSESGNVEASVFNAPNTNTTAEEVPAVKGNPSSTNAEEKVAVSSRQNFSVARSTIISIWDEPDDWSTQSEPIA